MPDQMHCPKCRSENVIFSKKRTIHECEDCGHTFTTVKPFLAHRIFLSYGHDEHTPVARRIRDDLNARGHRVWFDEERLAPGHEWETRIEDGLNWLAAARATSAVLLLLTPHSVRRPDGYCLNEVARALSRGLRVIPLMVVETEPPLSICRIQWLDMRACIPIHQKEALYRPRFERILKAVEDGQIDFEGTQQRLIKALMPLEFDADILLHIPRFTGRQWVFDAIKEWLQPTGPAAPPKSRVFWVSGAPGVGKTALSAALSSKYIEVAALHLCKFGHAQKSDPRRVVTSLAYQLSTQLPEYQTRLASMDVERLANDDARTMFDNLMVQALATINPPDRPIVILIDALDEATLDGYNELAGFIAAEFPKTPPWLRLLITSRPEEAVTAPLQGLDVFVLDTDTEANRSDLHEYLRRELAPQLMNRPDVEHFLQQVLQRSEGVFLYAERICHEVRNERLSLDRIAQFPQGLGAAFWQFFERHFPDRDAFRKDVRAALRAILAAREPLPLDNLQRLFGWQDEELRDFTRTLGSLFPVSMHKGHEVIKPYHKSLADWLGNESKAGLYFVSAKEGHRTLAAIFWAEYKRGVSTLSTYGLTHLPVHLLSAERWEDVEALLTDLDYLEAKTAAGQVFELAGDFAAAIALLPATRPQLPVLKLLNEALQRDIHFIARHASDYPQSLFQCLWNTCWWHDCPAADAHLVSPPGDEPSGNLNWKQEKPKLWKLLARWRDRKKRDGDLVPWLRSVNPSPYRLGTAQLALFRGHRNWVRAVACSPDGKFIATGSHDSTVRIWMLDTGRPAGCFHGHEDSVSTIAISPDGRYVASGSDDKTVRMWKVASGQEVHCFHGHTEVITSVGFSPQGDLLLSGSRDHSARVWDVSTGAQKMAFNDHNDFVYAVAFAPDSCSAATAGSDNTVRIWDIQTGRQRSCLTGHENTVTAVAFAAQKPHILSASRDGTLRIWDTNTGNEVRRFQGHTHMVHSAAFSPDGLRIVSGSSDSTVRLWDVATGEEVTCFEGHEGRVTSVAYAPDCRRLVTGGSDHTVRVWDVTAKQVRSRLRGHTGRVTCLAFSIDGRQMVSGSLDNTICLWDTRTGVVVHRFVGHNSGLYRVGFSFDGRSVISWSSDRQVRLWDVANGQNIEILPDHRCALTTPIVPNADPRISVTDADIAITCGERGAAPLWFPAPLQAVIVHPDRRLFAGAFREHIYLLSLEDESPLTPPKA